MVAEYLAVLKASYDYDKAGDDEVSIQEGKILLLVERTDDEYVPLPCAAPRCACRSL